MVRTVPVILLFLLFSQTLFSQDTIVLRSGEQLIVKVVEVAQKVVSYKKQTNLNGPTYKMDVYDVGRIKYESGALDEFNPVDTETKAGKGKTFDEAKLGNNIISLSIFEMAFEKLTISYERIIGDQKRIGLRIPICFRVGEPGSEIINPYKVLFYSGLDLNFYPAGQGRFKGFIGPTLRFGMARYNGDFQTEYGFSSVAANFRFMSFMVQGGFLWAVSKEISISSSLGFGMRRYLKPADQYSNVTIGAVNINFGVGYRF